MFIFTSRRRVELLEKQIALLQTAVEAQQEALRGLQEIIDEAAEGVGDLGIAIDSAAEAAIDNYVSGSDFKEAVAEVVEGLSFDVSISVR